MTLNDFIKEAQERLNIGDKKITLETNLVKDLSLDSIDAIDLIIGLENKYHVKFEDEKIQELVTVKDFLDYINKLIKEKEGK